MSGNVVVKSVDAGRIVLQYEVEGKPDSNDYFGYSSSSMGDLDGDGVKDLVVGAERDDDGGSEVGV